MGVLACILVVFLGLAVWAVAEGLIDVRRRIADLERQRPGSTDAPVPSLWEVIYIQEGRRRTAIVPGDTEEDALRAMVARQLPINRVVALHRYGTGPFAPHIAQ